MQDNLPDSITTLGAAIRHLRLQQGLSGRRLAELVGVSAPFVCDLEHERRSTTRLPAFAEALQVPLEQLERRAGRLSPKLQTWLRRNPGFIQLLERLQDSNLPADELEQRLGLETEE